MTQEQASIIRSFSALQWQTLAELIEEDRSTMLKELEDPGSCRDRDQYNKGGRAMGAHVLEYMEIADKILNPKKEGEE